MKNALKGFQKLDFDNSKRQIVLEKTITFSSLSEIEVQKIFKELKNQGIIIDTEYNDKTWVICSRLEDIHHCLKFESFQKETLSSIKAFATYVLNEYEPSTATAALQKLVKIISITNHFKDTNAKIINNIRKLKISDYEARICFDYLDFINISSKQIRLINEVIAEIRVAYKKNRDLPNFESVMKFDNLINDFTKNRLKSSKEYWPLVLWWKLSMVIPMRPIELFTLKEKDFFEENEQYYIHISRCLKSDPEDKYSHSIPIVSNYRISKKIYDLFQEYIKTVNIKQEGYIFNTDDNLLIRNIREFKGNSLLRNLQKNFYKKVVQGIYHYKIIKKEQKIDLDDNEIEKINYGDTRHFAFLNLIVSGYNPYTIAQLGGHRTLSAQLSYYSGITPFCTSKAYSLVRGIVDLDINNELSISEIRLNEVNKESQKANIMRKIEDGYCTSKKFPFECYSSSCAKGKCKYYIIEDIEQVNKEIQEVKEEINYKAELLKFLVYEEANSSADRAEICGTIQDKIIQLARLYKNKLMLEEG